MGTAGTGGAWPESLRAVSYRLLELIEWSELFVDIPRLVHSPLLTAQTRHALLSDHTEHFA